MPNTHVPANASALPSPTRRTLLATTLMAAIAAWPLHAARVGAKTQATAGGDTSDAELMALDREFMKALRAYDSVQRSYSKIERTFLAQRPSAPEELTDTHSELAKFLPSASTPWTSTDLRRLIRSCPVKRIRLKARDALRIAITYEQEVERVRTETGFNDAEAASRIANATLHSVAERIADAPAQSIVGLVIKARVVKLWAHPEWWGGAVALPERLAAQVLEGVFTLTAD